MAQIFPWAAAGRRPSGRRARRIGMLAALLGLGVLTAGCAGEAIGAPTPHAGNPQTGGVIVPGGPGGPNSTVPGTDVRPSDPAPAYNEADVRYLTMMIPHHRQALVMGDLAADRASDPDVQGLSERINESQGPELDMMSAWLVNHDQTVPTDDGTGPHPDMPGMATPAELEALGKAQGTAFDRMYLTLMRDHHRGAITMAERQLSEGTNERVSEMATGVIATQSAEIDRMTQMLDRLGG